MTRETNPHSFFAGPQQSLKFFIFKSGCILNLFLSYKGVISFKNQGEKGRSFLMRYIIITKKQDQSRPIDFTIAPGTCTDGYSFG